ncbi:MAG: XkdF-like putative serine protease domain-containing protein [Alphaproteobacteria bacterium]|nr:XkdF-like putative serine protease domain-containing protein [Alphaproteobacteria bacterium]
MSQLHLVLRKSERPGDVIVVRKRAPATEAQASVLGIIEEQRVVIGAVYVPEQLDTHGDFMTAEEIRKGAYDYMRKADALAQIDTNHDNVRTGSYVVESFISRKGDPDFKIEGTWVVGVHIPDDDVWEAVKRGEINGFSMEAEVQTRESSLLMPDYPASMIGMTARAGEDNHVHTFEVTFDAMGKVKAGKTSVFRDANGEEHFHKISHGTATDEGDGHAHRFAYVDLIQEMSNG